LVGISIKEARGGKSKGGGITASVGKKRGVSHLEKSMHISHEYRCRCIIHSSKKSEEF